ncbi:MAG: DEAD/DEAH box helicase [Candidatus Cloacimonadaceae bacterium]|jgi:ATP-dependent DNA helicase RecQ|nr:DEAD/DEAH box helicase [Candidatus Cloacimonadaceae bacterium]
MRQQAEAYLRTALNNPVASFRDGQWESIEQLLNSNRVLVVQRTGWGKSMVYFLATKLLRDQGAGPTLLISPLLSLMRNQLEAAQRIGITGRTINSTNNEEWEQIQSELASNQVDVLLISPERLANDDFRQNVLANMANNIGLFVIDEAHCISDWGHDFRPDYRRIVRVLQAIPSNVPVLATTATANDRVVNDVKSQLGQNIILQRGSLVRKSLKLQNINMPSPAARMAWLAQIIPTLPGSGIIYTLTQRDAERVTEWLQINEISSKAYHSGITPPDEVIPLLSSALGISIDEFNALKKEQKNASYKEHLEQQLLNNEIKVLVATVALGMGFDKPDLGFVIHFQRPASVVHYYQQVGRAGRAVDEAYGILLCGEEDDHIADFFIRNAFPPQQHISEILRALDEFNNGLSVPEMQRVLNLRKNQIDKTIKFLTVESPSPITKIGSKWQVTATAAAYQVNQAYVNAITDIRRTEQQQMRDYMEHANCLMAFLQAALDDPSPTACGQCRSCNPSLLLNESYDNDLANRAGLFLRRSYQPLSPRKQWPAKDMFQHSPLGAFKIPEALQAEEGRALSLWRDAGWGQLVAHGKYQTNRFADELVAACVEMLQTWSPDPAPQWVTCIPSLNHPELVPDFAARLATALGLPFVPCIEKARANSQQKFMENSYQQVRNLDGAFNINLEPKDYQPCLLVDDMIDSGWTFTVASALLRQVGCTKVYPMALALNSPRMD